MIWEQETSSAERITSAILSGGYVTLHAFWFYNIPVVKIEKVLLYSLTIHTEKKIRADTYWIKKNGTGFYIFYDTHTHISNTVISCFMDYENMDTLQREKLVKENTFHEVCHPPGELQGVGGWIPAGSVLSFSVNQLVMFISTPGERVGHMNARCTFVL